MKKSLQKTLKHFWSGSHRSVGPEQTCLAVTEAMKRAQLPLWDRIERIDSLDVLGLPVFAIIHQDIFHNSASPNWGKGSTEILAQVSGMMERVERYSASDVDKKKLLFDSFDNLKKPAISRWDLVPCNLQRLLLTETELDGKKIYWEKCFSLTKREDVLIPANLVYFLPVSEMKDFSYTAGLAAGNTLAEAILYALCELIEHHLEELYYRNQIKSPTIDLQSIDNLEIKKMVESYTANGLELCLSYTNLDFGLPVVRAFAFPKKGPYLTSYGFYAAMGVHPDKEVAITRALTELAQFRAAAIYVKENGLEKINLSEKKPQHIFDFFSSIIDPKKTIRYDQINNCASDDMKDEIELLVGVLEKKGCEIIFKDLTHPKLKIPVVRVIVKGLQPGIFGSGIVDLNHPAARIGQQLDCYDKYIKV